METQKEPARYYPTEQDDEDEASTDFEDRADIEYEESKDYEQDEDQ